jgi:hypothetical protein
MGIDGLTEDAPYASSEPLLLPILKKAMRTSRTLRAGCTRLRTTADDRAVLARRQAFTELLLNARICIFIATIWE